MIINGLNGLLASEATREVTFSCGFSLVFRKATLGYYAKRDDAIIRSRLNLNDKINALQEAFSKIDDESLKKVLVETVQAEIKELFKMQPYSYEFEIAHFEMSSQGNRFMVENLADCNPEQSVAILESFNEEDHEKFKEVINWAKEVEFIKN